MALQDRLTDNQTTIKFTPKQLTGINPFIGRIQNANNELTKIQLEAGKAAATLNQHQAALNDFLSYIVGELNLPPNEAWVLAPDLSGLVLQAPPEVPQAQQMIEGPRG